MVKSFANEVQGSWLNEHLQSALNNASHDFKDASAPVFTQGAKNDHLSEAQLSAAETSGGGDKTLSKPEPVLKPESQRGRLQYAAPAPFGLSPQIQPSQHQLKPQSIQQEQKMPIDQNKAWLAAHYWRAMNKARLETANTNPDGEVKPQVNDELRPSSSHTIGQDRGRPSHAPEQ